MAAKSAVLRGVLSASDRFEPLSHQDFRTYPERDLRTMVQDSPAFRFHKLREMDWATTAYELGVAETDPCPEPRNEPRKHSGPVCEVDKPSLL
jgi:hypothetical protein